MTYTPPRRPIAAYLRRQSDGSLWLPDAVREVSMDARWTVTDHPVESGLSVSDHVQVNPQTVTLTAVITENPTAPAVGGPQRVREALAWLRETADAGELVDIYTTRLGVLTNYLIAAVPHGLDAVSRVVFPIELREVRIAQVSTIQIDVETVAESSAASAPAEVDLGEQATTATEGEQEEADQSLLLSLLGG